MQGRQVSIAMGLEVKYKPLFQIRKNIPNVNYIMYNNQVTSVEVGHVIMM